MPFLDVITGTNPYSQNSINDKPKPFPVPYFLGQTRVGGDTTLDDRYNGIAIYYNGSSSMTLTFPATLMPGFTCEVIQEGSGQITLAAGTGASMNNRQSFTKTAGQFAMVGVIHRSDGVFYLGGDGST